ncbi:DUF6131 family protein [Streptomyces atratus]|uniref:DUF6131 family protein n=1 Tax=Streptomyces atratus TaxID=1893 RepID=UPI0009309613|nr:DUF6131 family protein [Streptomyces atratus]
MLAPGVHGVAGHDHTRQIGEGLQQWLEAGDLVGLLAHVELAIGIVLWILGSVGHAVGGRRHYW